MSTNVITQDDVFNIVNSVLSSGSPLDRSKVSINQVDSILVLSPYLSINGEVEESRTYVIYTGGKLIVLPRVVGLTGDNITPDIEQGGVVDVSSVVGGIDTRYLESSFSFIASISYVSRYSVDSNSYVLDCAVVNYCPIDYFSM